jgi:hypothetical protein
MVTNAGRVQPGAAPGVVNVGPGQRVGAESFDMSASSAAGPRSGPVAENDPTGVTYRNLYNDVRRADGLFKGGSGGDGPAD